MKKAVLLGFGVIVTLLGTIGFLLLPVLIHLVVTQCFDMSAGTKLILFCIAVEGCFVQAGILEYFSKKEYGGSPLIILKVSLLPLAIILFATIITWPAILLEFLGFGNTAQILGTLAWIVVLIFSVIVIAVYEPKES